MITTPEDKAEAFLSFSLSLSHNVLNTHQLRAFWDKATMVSGRVEILTLVHRCEVVQRCLRSWEESQEPRVQNGYRSLETGSLYGKESKRKQKQDRFGDEGRCVVCLLQEAQQEGSTAGEGARRGPSRGRIWKD